jgi:predicted DCC family thiol-disulfide oxidoreductase YuxK
MRTFGYPPGILAAREDELEVFYDGECGLCHGFVRFILAQDTLARISFTPIGSAGPWLRDIQIDTLPDSIIVRTSSGQVLVRSQAVLAVLDHLGGVWRVLSVLFRFIPRPLRDLVYDGVAQVRRRMFPKPPGACPVMPPEFRSRFRL